MTTLAELAKLDGVVLAFEFAPDGRLLTHEAAAATSPGAAEICAVLRMRDHEFQHARWRIHQIEQHALGAPAGLGVFRR